MTVKRVANVRETLQSEFILALTVTLVWEREKNSINNAPYFRIFFLLITVKSVQYYHAQEKRDTFVRFNH